MRDIEKDYVIYKVEDGFEMIRAKQLSGEAPRLIKGNKIILLNTAIYKYQDLGDLTLCTAQDIPPREYELSTGAVSYSVVTDEDPLCISIYTEQYSTAERALVAYEEDGLNSGIPFPIERLLESQVDYDSRMSRIRGTLLELTDGNTYVLYET